MKIKTVGLAAFALAASLSLSGPASAASEAGTGQAPYYMCYVDMHSEFSDDCGDLVVQPEQTTGSISLRAEADENQTHSYLCYVGSHYVSAADCGEFFRQQQPATTGSVTLPVSQNTPEMFMCYVGDQYVCADFPGNPATAGSVPSGRVE
jgi:hypothetical protein